MSYRYLNCMAKVIHLYCIGYMHAGFTLHKIMLLIGVFKALQHVELMALSGAKMSSICDVGLLLWWHVYVYPHEVEVTMHAWMSADSTITCSTPFTWVFKLDSQHFSPCDSYGLQFQLCECATFIYVCICQRALFTKGSHCSIHVFHTAVIPCIAASIICTKDTEIGYNLVST